MTIALFIFHLPFIFSITIGGDFELKTKLKQEVEDIAVVHSIIFLHIFSEDSRRLGRFHLFYVYITNFLIVYIFSSMSSMGIHPPGVRSTIEIMDELSFDNNNIV